MRKLLSFLLVFAVSAIIALLLSSILVLVYGLVFPSQNTYKVDASIIELLKVVIWPISLLTAAVILGLITNFFGDVAKLIGRISGLKAGDYEISFSSEGAQKLSADLESDIKTYAEKAKKQYDRISAIHHVKSMLGNCVAELSKSVPDDVRADGFATSSIRATIYIQDVVFADALYQLTDYYPSGGGAGRRFSVRFGAIGLAWRSQRVKVWNGRETTDDVNDLIRNWGMYRFEAEHAQNFEASICIPLVKSGKREGVLYLDSKSIESFLASADTEDDTKRLSDFISKFFLGDDSSEPDVSVTQLIDALSKTNSTLAESSARIEIYAKR